MGKHDHASCEHLVAWCRHCDTVFCKNPGCGMEWVVPCSRPHYLGMSGGSMPFGQFGVIAGNAQGGNAIPGPIRADQVHGLYAEDHVQPPLSPYQKPGHVHHTPWSE